MGIYADRASGKNSNRPEFQRLISDCHNVSIDLILTTSISRFARNTLDMLNTVRELKSIGVDILFELEGIRVCGSDSEFYITAVVAYAQEESRQRNENIRWGLQRAFG